MTRTFADYGVLWSGTRPEVAAGDGNDLAVSARWFTLYHAPAGAATAYPQASPYAQITAASGVPDFILQPSAAHRPGVEERRLLTVLIVNCPTSPGSCQEARVRGVGRFFMQRQATSSNLNVEFDRLLDKSELTGEIRLYR